MSTKYSFFDLDHARRYLLNSIIRKNGFAIYITDIETSRGSLKLYYRYLCSGEPNDCYIDNETLDFSPVSLGFVNLISDVLAVARIPQRQWVIGLTLKTMVASNLYLGKKPWRQSVYCTKFLGDTIDNNFPKFKTHVEYITAFHRHWAIDSQQNIYYYRYMEPVAKYTGNNSVVFQDGKKFLKEKLSTEGFICL